MSDDVSAQLGAPFYTSLFDPASGEFMAGGEIRFYADDQSTLQDVYSSPDTTGTPYQNPYPLDDIASIPPFYYLPATYWIEIYALNATDPTYSFFYTPPTYNSQVEYAITSAGITFDANDSTQLAEAVTDYVGLSLSYSDSGSENNYILEQPGDFEIPTDLTNNFKFQFLPLNSNTGASTMTITTKSGSFTYPIYRALASEPDDLPSGFIIGSSSLNAPYYELTYLAQVFWITAIPQSVKAVGLVYATGDIGTDYPGTLQEKIIGSTTVTVTPTPDNTQIQIADRSISDPTAFVSFTGDIPVAVYTDTVLLQTTYTPSVVGSQLLYEFNSNQMVTNLNGAGGGALTIGIYDGFVHWNYIYYGGNGSPDTTSETFPCSLKVVTPAISSLEPLTISVSYSSVNGATVSPCASWTSISPNAGGVATLKITEIPQTSLELRKINPEDGFKKMINQRIYDHDENGLIKLN